MFTNTFTYTPISVGEPMIAQIAQDDEFYFVSIGDTSLGCMVRDDNEEFGWKTDDPLLLEELPQLSIELNEQAKVYNLPYAIKDLFGENIVNWEWNEDKTLNLFAHADTDLVEFASFVRDQIFDVVLFEKDLIIYLSKPGGEEVEEIHINC